MKRLLMLIGLIMSSIPAWCQKDSSTHHHLIFTNFQLRQSFETADEQESPAMIQLTIPEGSKSSWLLDAAAAVSLRNLSHGAVTSKIAAEYHRNTALNHPQNNYQIGYNFRYFERGKSDFKKIITGNIKYIRDVQYLGNSIAATINITGYRAVKHSLNLGRPCYLFNERYTYNLSPYFASQYQQTFTSNTLIKAGAIVRPVINFSASFSKNKISSQKKAGIPVLAPPKLIEVFIDYTNRYAIVNTTASRERFTKLFKTGLNYYLLTTDTKSVSLGANFNLGSDPLNGLKNQHFWRFSLQIQI